MPHNSFTSREKALRVGHRVYHTENPTRFGTVVHNVAEIKTNNILDIAVSWDDGTTQYFYTDRYLERKTHLTEEDRKKSLKARLRPKVSQAELEAYWKDKDTTQKKYNLRSHARKVNRMSREEFKAYLKKTYPDIYN